jgi:hypothetical protein
MRFSLNETLIVEKYKLGQGLKSTGEDKGFAFIKQKVDIVGLKLLVEARLDGTYIPVGSMVYVEEDKLSTQPWSKSVRKSPPLGDQEFILVPLREVAFIDTLENEK